MFKSNEKYADKVKLLRKLGVIDKSYNLNTKLNSGQKANISKKWAEWAHVAKHPEEFAARHVSPKVGQKFKESEFLTVKTGKKVKVFIPAEPGSHVQIKKGHAFVTNKELTRRKRIIPALAKDLVSELEKYGKKKLPPGQFLMIRIGRNREIDRMFNGAADLLKYVQVKSAGGGKYKNQNINAWESDDAIRHITIIETLDTSFAIRAEARREKAAQRKETKKGKGKKRK